MMAIGIPARIPRIDQAQLDLRGARVYAGTFVADMF